MFARTGLRPFGAAAKQPPNHKGPMHTLFNLQGTYPTRNLGDPLHRSPIAALSPQPAAPRARQGQWRPDPWPFSGGDVAKKVYFRAWKTRISVFERKTGLADGGAYKARGEEMGKKGELAR